MNNHQRTEKLRATAFDGLAAALSPALIIGMIGSLVFFLVIAFYRGQYDARLMYILALYTAATVLVARIAIESDRARAAAFAVPLAIAALLGMMRFVTISGELAALSWIVNVGLLALTWYLADRITFDCTLLEEDRESLQGGLLQTIGSSVAQAAGQENKPAHAAVPGSPASSAGKQPIGAAPLKKAKHNPGVWVLYFALIAFPLFGVGQLVIPDERQRTIAFWCLVTYLACALALLMTTSLLGMRRYLRQRGAMMPPDITAKWLVAGGLITCVILLVCMLMPLPGKQLSVAGMKFELTSPTNLPTSKFGWGSEGPDNGQAGQASEEARGEGQQPDPSQQPQPNNQANNKPGQGQAQKQGQPSQEPDGQGQPAQSARGQPDADRGQDANQTSQSNQTQSGDTKSSSADPQSGSQAGSPNDPNKQSSQKQSGQDKGQQPSTATGEQPKAAQSNEQPKGNSLQADQPNGNRPGKNEPGKNEPGKNEPGKNEPGKNEPGKNEPGKNEPGKNEPGKNEPGKNEPGKNEPGKNEPGKNEPSKNEPGKSEPPKSEPAKSEPAKSEPAKSEPAKSEPAKSEPLRAGNSLSQTSRSLASQLLETLKSFASMFKWLMIAVLAGIVLFYVVTHIDEVKRLITDLMNFINALLGRRSAAIQAEQTSSPSADAQPERRPFSSFANPFAKGLKGWQGPQVVQHTFAALEAWAAQRGRVRPVDQTAEEFARGLLRTEPELERLPLQAANMLDRVMFANWQPTREEVSALSELWERMR